MAHNFCTSWKQGFTTSCDNIFFEFSLFTELPSSCKSCRRMQEQWDGQYYWLTQKHPGGEYELIFFLQNCLAKQLYIHCVKIPRKKCHRTRKLLSKPVMFGKGLKCKDFDECFWVTIYKTFASEFLKNEFLLSNRIRS